MIEAGPFVNVAQNSISYASNIGINEWLAQYATYQSCLIDTIVNGIDTGSILHGNTVLQDFRVKAAVGRFGYVANLERAVASGDASGAFTVWASTPTAYYTMQTDANGVQIMDTSAADGIVANYRSYYKAYLDYVGDSLSSTDTSTIEALANGCPLTDGAMVYQARALYALVFNSLGDFNDYGCSAGGAGKPLPKTDTTQAWDQPGIDNATGGQHYRLHPNPGNGNIYIQQALPDDDPVIAEVWSSEGKRIYRDKLLFSGGMKNIDLTGITPGLYLLQLRDSKGNNFVLKFIVNK
jgi:hypothetical protein